MKGNNRPTRDFPAYINASLLSLAVMLACYSGVWDIKAIALVPALWWDIKS